MQRTRRITLIFLVAILCLLTGMAVVAFLRGCLPEAESPMVREWIELYAEGLAEAIVCFETVTSSWEAFQEGETTLLEEVAAGTAQRARQTDVILPQTLENIGLRQEYS
jgi:hypothetical protein